MEEVDDGPNVQVKDDGDDRVKNGDDSINDTSQGGGDDVNNVANQGGGDISNSFD